MNHTAKELESGAIREIEPEVRTLFTKVVERDPREAARMLEPYPDEFIVQMLELLNPASALKILQRFDPSRRQTVLATASPETNQQWMRNQTYPERTIGRLIQPPLAVFSPQTTVAQATEQIRRLARKTIITYAFVTDEQEKLLGGRCHARHAAGTKQSAPRGNHAQPSVLSHAGDVAARSNESGAGSALSGLSGLRQNGTTTRPLARSDVI